MRPCGGCGRPLIPMQTCEHILNPSLPTRTLAEVWAERRIIASQEADYFGTLTLAERNAPEAVESLYR